MKIFIQHSFLIWLSFLLSGCCTLECVAPLGPSQPYGAHWIKDGMTKESRRADIAACGAKGNESVNFLPHEIEAAKHPEDFNNVMAESRLTKKWAECMRNTGYVYLEYCDNRCLYP